MLAQALLHSSQRGVQLPLSSVVCSLTGAEPRLIYTIVDLQHQDHHWPADCMWQAGTVVMSKVKLSIDSIDAID